MTFSSFIFYIDEEPNSCGCYYGCDCPRYRSYIDTFYKIEDAAEYMAKKINDDMYGYVHNIFINGISIYNKPNLIVVKKNRWEFNNPINRGNHDEVTNWFPPELYEDSNVDQDMLKATLKTLDKLVTVTGMLVKPALIAKNEAREKDIEERLEKQRKHDLEKLAALKKLYPEA